MLNLMFYVLWILFVSICIGQIGTIYLCFKKKYKIKKFIIPVSLNYLLSAFIEIIFLNVFVYYIYGHMLTSMFLISVLLLFVLFFGANIITFLIYCKKKKKATTREYILSSLFGMSYAFLYLIQMFIL